MRRASSLTARVELETDDGERAEGYSADLLVPKWFDKDPAKSAEENVVDLVESARAAGAAFTAPDLPLLAPFELWHRVYRDQPVDPELGLVRGFGVALLERAVIDAACRAAGLSFFEALARNALGFEPGEVHAELAGWDLAFGLAPPSASVRVRHTVGMLDPLRAEDVPPGELVSDGFPQALEQDVVRYGLTAFKVKVGADTEANAGRLVEVARVLRELLPENPLLTLDGNESLDDLGEVARLLDRVAADPDGAWLLEGLAYVEQPLSRARSFDPGANAGIAALPAPVILDEADYGLEAFPRAIELGYGGISAKNCKGVFRTLLNRGLCEVRGGGLFQAAEDLTTLPVLALQQDLATVAALGLEHVERNGHHYFPGLRHLTPDERRAALAEHPDLYRPREAEEAEVELAIDGGRLQLDSLRVPGYGYAVPIAVDHRVPVDEWSASRSAEARAGGSG